MATDERSGLYNELKAAGVKFDKHFRDYTVAELQEMLDRLHEQPGFKHDEPDEEISGDQQTIAPPMLGRPGDAFAGQHAYTHADEDVIRVDDQGRRWIREEVLKPAIPSPRKRRVLTYVDPGTETKTVVNGQYMETFEVAGQRSRTAEVKITMPSYQVGVYIDERFPFKVHTYAGKNGFNLFDVNEFYGGADLVPAEVKTTYVANDLCYDIRSTIRAIEAEYRRQQLNGVIE